MLLPGGKRQRQRAPASIRLLRWLVAIASATLVLCSHEVRLLETEGAGRIERRNGLLRAESTLAVAGVAAGNTSSARVYDDDREEELSVCVLLIVRDEESSLRANLPLWQELASCYVIGVDDRTIDGTVQALVEILPEDKPRFVFLITFENFSQARNAVLRSAWHHFPGVSHLLFVDADWRPDQQTVHLSDLDSDHSRYHFQLWDQNGHTSRMASWLVPNDPGFSFKYRLHEALDGNAVSSKAPKFLPWHVSVVENNSSWHGRQHEHSRSADRFLFDMKLLELDYKDDPTDLHTLFYLGITTYSYMETLTGKGVHNTTPELEELVKNGMFYFHTAVNMHGDRLNNHFVWSSLKWLGYAYQFFIGNVQEAEKWYRRCMAYDTTRIDCTVFLSRLYLTDGNLDAAWETAKTSLLYRDPKHRAMDFFYIHECFAPRQAATVIAKRVSEGRLGEDPLDIALTLGWYLMRHHHDHCKGGTLVDTPEDVASLESWFQGTIEREGLNVSETRHRVLHSSEAFLTNVLLNKWGTGAKARYTGPFTTEINEKTEYSALPKDSGLITSEGNPLVPPLVAGRDCTKILQQARARLQIDGRGEPGSGTPISKLLEATTLAQINAAMPGPAAPWGRGANRPFRALLFGGRGGRDRGGLESEDLLHVVSLLIQLSSSPHYFHVTYVHSDRSTLEALQAVVAGCRNELGIANGNLHLLRATLGDFLNASSADEPFDFVDMGGPLAAGGKSHGGGENAGDAVMVGSETLRRLGPMLAPGACLKVWAFAANPSTELVFRAAVRHNTALAAGPTRKKERVTSHTSPRNHNKSPEMLIGKILRKTFGFEEARETNQRDGDRPEKTEDVEVVTPGSERDHDSASAAEEAWARRVLAGGDRLGIADIDEVLTDAEFELTLMLGRGRWREHGEGVTRGLVGMEEALEEQGLSRWELADFAESLQPSPPLVHQALAVWRGGESSTTAAQG